MYRTDSIFYTYGIAPFTLMFAETPALVFYSHLTAIVVTMLVGIIVFLKLRTELVAKILLSLASVFSLLSVIDVLLWVLMDVDLVMFFWSLWFTLFTLSIMLGWYFLYVFVFKKDISWPVKLIAAVFLLALEAVSATRFGLIGFDIAHGNALENPSMLYVVFAGAVFLSVYCSVIILRRIFNVHDLVERKIFTLLFLGVSFFNFVFIFITFLASVEFLFVLKEQESFLVEQYGYYAMTVFYALLAYLIVSYKVFNTKIFASQALVATLWILIGSLLLVVKSTTSRIITTITLALSVAFGMALIRSVRKEVESRNMLAEANAGQERFIHFLSHEVKGYLTVARNGFAAIGQGDLGLVSEDVATVSRSALARLNDGVNTVENILKSANLKSGKFTFAFAPFDLAGVLHTQVEAARSLAEGKGVALGFDIPEGEYICVGDRQNLADHVFRNLIENAIYYTEQGSVRVSLTRVDDSFVIRIVDTGIGISSEDKLKLFTEGGRGADSLRHNVHSTGHGLFIAKSIVEAHKGAIRALSVGQGKGTTFEVELPMRRK